MRKEKKDGWKQRIVVYAIAFIMISSIAGFIYGNQNQNQKYNYNGYKFIKKADEFGNSIWVTDLNKKEARFNFFPTEVIDINVSGDIINKLSNVLEIDLTSSFNSTNAESIGLASYEFSQEMGFHYNKFIRTGFIENTTYNLPIISCNEATNLIPVIYFVEGNETLIYQEGDCIIAQTRLAVDSVKIKDRLLYGIYGIIG